MGKCRFLYNSYLTPTSYVAASSLLDGVLTVALKQGTGSATLTPGGTYIGIVDIEYTVEIDSIAGGAEVGQATFKWSDGGGVWDDTGVTTDTDPITLNNGVTVAFTSGSGADFVVGDKWYFKAFNLFNAAKLTDWNRDHIYRSAALESPNQILMELDSAQSVSAIAIWDHNLTNAATITLNGHTSSLSPIFGPPAPSYTQAVTYNAGNLLYYLPTPQTYRYWRLDITDLANSDSYIEIGELYLGSYLELSKTYKPGFGTDWTILQDINRTAYNVETERVYNIQKIFTRTFDPITAADITSIQTMLIALADHDTGRNQPFYFNENSASPNDSYMVRLNGFTPTHREATAYGFALEMREVLPSV